MKLLRIQALVGMVMALGTGCAAGTLGDDTPRLDTRSVGIIGGSPHAGDPAVLYLMQDGRFSCTGSLIAPRVVLTAKHCVQSDGGAMTPASRMSVGTGPDADGSTPYANVTAIRAAPGGLEAGDIALLILDRAGSLTPYRYVTDSPPAAGARVIGIGYGQTTDSDGGGRKFRGESTIGFLDAQEFTTSGALSCYGDSGGPGFLADGRIFGVVSRGTTDSCERGQTVYVRTDAFRSLIESAIAEGGGAAPPPGDPPPGGDPTEPPPGGGDPTEPPPDGGDSGEPPPPPGGSDPGTPPPGGEGDSDGDGCPDHVDAWPYDWEPEPYTWWGEACGGGGSGGDPGGYPGDCP